MLRSCAALSHRMSLHQKVYFFSHCDFLWCRVRRVCCNVYVVAEENRLLSGRHASSVPNRERLERWGTWSRRYARRTSLLIGGSAGLGYSDSWTETLKNAVTSSPFGAKLLLLLLLYWLLFAFSKFNCHCTLFVLEIMTCYRKETRQ